MIARRLQQLKTHPASSSIFAMRSCTFVFWFCACRIYMRWAKKLPFTCSTLQKHFRNDVSQGVNVCSPTRIFMLILSRLFGWHSTESIRSSPTCFSWTSCPVITEQNVFSPSARNFVSPFSQDFTRHSRVQCGKNPSIFSSVAPQKNPCCCLQLCTPICSSTKGHGAWRWNLWPDNIAMFAKFKYVMSCLTALHDKKKLKLISSCFHL